MGGRSLPVDVQCKSGLQMAMQSRSKCYGGWPNGETCAVSEGRSVFSDPLAVD